MQDGYHHGLDDQPDTIGEASLARLNRAPRSCFIVRSMELIYVRRGEPGWTIDTTDRIDAPLADRGCAQARLTARRFVGEFAPLSGIIVSAAVRALETGPPIADLVELPMESFAGLVDSGIPDWAGVSDTMIVDTFDESFNRPPGAVVDWARRRRDLRELSRTCH